MSDILIDFTNCELSSRNLQYGGRAGEKRGIIHNGTNWILKFPKNASGMRNVGTLSYVTSPLSEYIGSQIFKILGFSVHNTVLGIYYTGSRYKVVCACEDFIKDESNEMLIPYTAIRNDTEQIIMDKKDTSSSQSPSSLDEILFQLDHNTIFKTIPNAKYEFWKMLIVDMLINNNDRNEDNWGVIKYKEEGKYKLAPIYDCGNSFYGKTPEEKIDVILQNKDRLFSSALNGVTAFEDENGDRIQLVHILDFNDPLLLKAINEMYSIVIEKLSEIENLIMEIPENFNGLDIISEQRKNYYIETFKLRLHEILEKRLSK